MVGGGCPLLKVKVNVDLYDASRLCRDHTTKTPFNTKTINKAVIYPHSS